MTAWPAMCSRRRGHSSAAALDSASGDGIDGNSWDSLFYRNLGELPDAAGYVE